MNSSVKEVFNWASNPFNFKILPDLFVGYGNEIESIFSGLDNGDKFVLLLGPTGSGKTTLLKHISGKFENFKVIYISKPPKNPEDWVQIFNPIIKRGFFSSLFHKGNGVNIYNLSDNVNSRLGDVKCLLFVDEVHEADIDSLEWLRTLTDQIENLTVILAGLPTFENMLQDSLETFLRRVTVRVDLGSLTQAETREFIKKRIESVGGEDIRPFTSSILESIHQRTGGFPREILKICNDLSQKAVRKGLTTIDSDLLEETEITTRISIETIDSLPPRQKLLVETLSSSGPLTPTELVEKFQASGEYKDQENAIRSVNNLLRRLMADGMVERKKSGKAYSYSLSPRYKTLMVNA